MKFLNYLPAVATGFLLALPMIETYPRPRFSPVSISPLLKKRGFDLSLPSSIDANTISALGVKASDLATQQLETIPSTARNLQLLTVGVSPMSVSGYINFFGGFSTYTSGNISVNALIADRFVAPVVIILIISIVILILFPFLACCFCCCRMADRCGGRKPNEDGYSRKGLLAIFGFFVCVAAVNIFGASLVMVYSTQLKTSIGYVTTGAEALVGDAVDFTSNLRDGVKSSPAVLTNSLNSIVSKIAGLDYKGSLNQTLDKVMASIQTNLISLDGSVKNATSLITSIAAIVAGAKNSLTAIPASLSSINSQLNTMKTVTINNQLYSIPNFPDTSALASPTLPDLTSVPDINSYKNQLSSVPDLSQLANDAVGQYRNLTGGINGMINTTLSSMLPNPANLTSSLISSVDTMFNGIINLMKDAKTQTTTYKSMAIQYIGYVNDALTIEAAIIIALLSVTLFGMIIKKHKLMSCMPPFAVIFCILVWIQFIVFYYISLPINVACVSRNLVINDEYSVSDFKIQPSAIVNSCRGGSNIFSAKVNTNGDSAVGLVKTFINSMFSFDSLIKNGTLKNMINIPNPSSQISSVTNINFENFNSNALNIADPITFNLTKISSDLRAATANLTPTSFNSDLGNTTLRDSSLADFNTVARSANGGWLDWNVTYVVNAYLLTNAVFSPTVVTSNSAQHSAISTAYASSYSRISFVYNANVTITILRSNATTVANSIDALNTGTITPLRANISTLAGYSTTVASAITSVKNGMNAVLGDANNFGNATSAFIDFCSNGILGALNNGTNSLVNNLLLTNPVQNFGSCLALAEHTVVVVEGLCSNLLNSFSGLWFAFVILGVFLIFGFIFGMKSKKRVEYLERRNSTVRVKGKKGSSAYDAESAKAQQTKELEDGF